MDLGSHVWGDKKHFGSLKMLALSLFLLLATCLPNCFTFAADPPPSPKHVLIIYSFDREIPWQVRVRKGLIQGLNTSDASLVVYEETMDANLFPGPGHADLFKEYLEKKYVGKKIDVLVTESGPASVLVAETPGLFAGVQRLFVNPTTPVVEQFQETPGAYLIVMSQDIVKSFDTMLEITQTRHAVVIGETATPLVRRSVEHLRRERPSNFNGIRVDFLLDQPMDVLSEKVRHLPKDCAIFYVLMFRDGAGQTLVPYQAAQQIAANSSVPVFSHWDSLLGSGIAGGYVLSGEKVGLEAADSILRLLSGEKSNLGQEVTGRAFAQIYDWRALQRFGLSTNRLPPGSELLYEKPSPWTLYWPYIVGAGALVGFLSLVVSILARALVQRRSAVAALKEERLHLEDRVEARTKELSLSNQRLEQLNLEILAKNENLEKALGEIHTLRGFLPICASCKKIRDDQGYWSQVEEYISQRSEAVFSHSICPDCMLKMYPKYVKPADKD